MLKKYIFLLISILAFSNPVFADSKGLNIFAFPREAPQTAIYTPAGKAVSLSDFKGEFLMVVFWSRNCVPCIKELDNLNTFVKKTRDNGIKVILVSKAEEWHDMNEQKRFLDKFKAPDLDYYVDKKGKLTEDFGIFASPHTVLINTKGEEIGRIRGSVEWDDRDVIEYMYKLKAQQG